MAALQKTQFVTIIMCVSAVWFSTSCHAMSRNATATQVVEPTVTSPTPRFVPHEVLIKFKEGISREKTTSILKENRIAIIAEIQPGRLYHVVILDERSVESAIAQLVSYQEIEYAEPNYRYETQK